MNPTLIIGIPIVGDNKIEKITFVQNTGCCAYAPMAGYQDVLTVPLITGSMI